MTVIRRVAVYARVSTNEQTCENQLLELRRYVDARGWIAIEYVDTGVSGAKDRRPAGPRSAHDRRAPTSGRCRRLLAP
jgi:DNA invertase Pin-like site-specific DNA recombinase